MIHLHGKYMPYQSMRLLSNLCLYFSWPKGIIWKRSANIHSNANLNSTSPFLVTHLFLLALNVKALKQTLVKLYPPKTRQRHVWPNPALTIFPFRAGSWPRSSSNQRFYGCMILWFWRWFPHEKVCKSTSTKLTPMSMSHSSQWSKPTAREYA